MADPENRRAALTAAAALIGPTVPGGIVDRRPDEAAKALTRMADLLLPWLEDHQDDAPEPEGHDSPVDPRDHPPAV